MTMTMILLPPPFNCWIMGVCSDILVYAALGLKLSPCMLGKCSVKCVSFLAADGTFLSCHEILLGWKSLHERQSEAGRDVVLLWSTGPCLLPGGAGKLCSPRL